MDIRINFFLVIVLVLLGYNIYEGYKKGMVKEAVSFISLIFLCIIFALAGNGISSYKSNKILNVFITLFLLAGLGIIHHLIKVALFPAKILSKLPVIHSLDKVLGIVFGVLETALMLWTVYAFAGILDLGGIGNYILKSTAEVPFLAWLYEHNFLVGSLRLLGAKVSERLQLGDFLGSIL